MNQLKKIDSKEIEDIIALTPMQEGMLFHYLKNSKSNHYFEQLSLEISGEIDVEIFEKSWNVVIEANEMLRAVFRWEKLEKSMQIILKEHKCKVIFYDLSKKDSSRKKMLLEEIKNKDRLDTFDLHQVPFRVILCKLDVKKYEMVISNHHILYDGWSNGIILKEFFKAYHDLSDGKELLRPVKTRFREFVKWNQNRDLDESEKFWKNYLKGFDTPTELRIKRRPEKDIPLTESFKISFSQDLTGKIADFVKNHQITLAAFLYSAWGVLLQKYCNSGDVIFGTTVSGRSAPIKGIEDMVGLFINTIPLRVKTGTREKIKDLLCKINNILLLRETHESTPLVDIKGYSKLKNNEELFDSIVVLENYPLNRWVMGESCPLSLAVHSYSMMETTNYNLTIGILIGDTIEIGFNYNRALFEKNQINRLAHHFINIIKNILIDYRIEIPGLGMLAEEEKSQILYDFNRTAVDYLKDKTIQELFKEQVEKTPDNIALIFQDKELTYRELSKKANQLAYLLQSKGVQPNTLVGLMVERSLEMLIGIFSILKAGGAYLPIDPDYPGERIKFMLADSGAKVLVTGPEPSTPVKVEAEVEEDGGQSQGLPLQLINLKNVPESLTLTSTSTLSQVGPSNLAYIIYTSGSTGEPKGILVEHYSVVNLVFSQKRQFDINENDRVLQFSPICFDASVEQIFIALLSGAVLVLVDRNTLLDSSKFEEFISSRSITHLHAVPSFLSNVKVKDTFKLKRVISGGDVCPVALAKKWSKHCDFYNEYGPTETTVTSIEMRVGCGDVDESLSRLPVGRPIGNTTVYLFDQWKNPVPLGVVGELYIGGDGVARGYLNNPELTAEKFKRAVIGHSSLVISRSSKLSPNDQCPMTNERLYKTGDLAQWLPDGNIEYLGRMDHQVKIRGFRIELREIESQLLKHEAIKETVVIARGDDPGSASGISGDNYLCSYIVLHSSHSTYSPKSLREYLSNLLPDYMIPSYFVQVDKIPLTPSGKLDRKALPAPKITSEEKYTAPRTHIERELVEIWSEVLSRDAVNLKIGIDDSFFELGGHSLKATILISKIHKKLDVIVPLVEVFKRKTIRRLSGYIKDARETKYTDIGLVEKREYYALSSAQKRLYFLQQMNLGSTSYNMTLVLPLDHVGKDIDKEKLEFMLKKLISRHESLRTSFLMMDKEPVQRIHDEVEFEIENYDMKEVEVKVEEYEGTRGLAPLLIKNFIRPFNLSHPPLMRSSLIGLPNGNHLWIVDMHHIISDGTSSMILADDFISLYYGDQLEPLALQYKDFSEWQNSEKEKERIKEQKAYWLKEFEEEIPILHLPTDYTRPAIQSFAVDSCDFELEEDLIVSLNELTLIEGVTLFMVLLAAVNIMLAKLSGQEEIVMGTPTAGRRHADLEKIIGMFVNTIALKNNPKGEKPFNLFLREIKERTLDAFENQEYQFEDLVDNVCVTRDASRNPLFDVMFSLQSTILTTPGKPDAEKSAKSFPAFENQHYYENRTAKFDLTITTVETANKLLFSFQYCTKLFKKETIERFIIYFKKILSAVVEEPTVTLRAIDILPEAEKQKILYHFNDTDAVYPLAVTVCQLFEEQAKKHPHSIAVMGAAPGVGTRFITSAPGKRNIYITYHELNKKSNQLARLLRAKGLQPDTIAGIMVEQSIEMVIGILAILKAGGAYLPIDPQYPQQRIMFFLQDSRSDFLLTQKKLISKQGTICEIIDLEEKKLYKGDTSNLEMLNIPTDLAYVIYTSGSTGTPKGTLIQHNSLNNLCHWHNKYYSVTARDRATKYAGFGFDASVWEIFPYLISGASLYIIHKEIKSDIHRLNYFFEENNITIAFLPTQLCEQFMTLQNHSLRILLTGGDKLRTFIDRNYQLVNNYGPTENTVVAASFIVDKDYVNIPIGKPVDNTKLYVLNQYRQLQPPGVPGELCISGSGLSRGYLNQPELTMERFCLRRPGGLAPLLYRTGDLARWLPDGNIDFLGRIDHQVKIRGFRIELGEIENKLLTYPGIKASIVTTSADETGDKYLCAYIVAEHKAQGAGCTTADLKEYLSGSLPDYMIPSYFVFIEKIPLTLNGKVDRKALPTPEAKAVEDRTTNAPRNQVEEKLAEIWSDVLGIRKEIISIDDNFFQLGGHSLKMTILAAKIHQKLAVKLPIVELFKTPTIRDMAALLQGVETSGFLHLEQIEKKEFYELSYNQRRLWITHQFEPDNAAYNMPARFALKYNAEDNLPEKTIHELVRRHESLRTGFKEVNNHPVQFVANHVEIPLKKIDISPVAGYEKQQQMEQIFFQEAQTVFDLSRVPLFRVVLVKLDQENFVMIFNMHHIISDGWSIEILKKEFLYLYEGYRKGETRELDPIKWQYKDFTQWQDKKLSNLEIKKQSHEFWKKTVAKEIPVMNLPFDFPGGQNAREAAAYHFSLPIEIKDRLNQLAKHNSTSLFVVMLSLFHLLLRLISGQEDIRVGLPVWGRDHAALQNIVGFFVNTVIIDTHVEEGARFIEFLAGVHAMMMEILHHQSYPLELVLEDLNLKFPRVNVFFNMLNLGTGPIQEELPSNTPYHTQKVVDVKFDLMLYISEFKNGIQIDCHYNKALFRAATVVSVMEKYSKIIDFFTAHPGKSMRHFKSAQQTGKKRSLKRN
jgi:amino acid adenylation domain-containing protein